MSTRGPKPEKMMRMLGFFLLLALSGVRAQDYAALDATQAAHVADVITQVDAHHGDACVPPSAAARPNILMVLVDDLGFSDISWNTEGVETPNLDALAKDGIILDRNYVQPVCSPSRGAFITGKYAHRVGMQHSVIYADVPEGLGTEHKTIAEYLQPHGYHSHYLGKWHLGFCNEKYLPTNRGFDSFYGFYNSHIDHYTHINDGQYDFFDNGVVDLAGNMSYGPSLVRDRALEIIENHDSSDPLFLMYSDPLPHTPLQLPPEVETPASWRDKFLAMVKVMDSNIGKLVQAFKDKGLYDNSVIVFTSDNGGMAYAYFARNEPLRGAKGGIFEGGTRVPAMIHSPLQTAKGVRHTGSFHIADWTPTFLNLAGGCAEGLDGVNQQDMLLHGGPSARDEVVYNIDQYSPYTFGHGAIRMGDYKLILGYPGKYDGYTTDFSIGQTYLVDIMGLRTDEPESGEAHSDLFAEYLELTDGFAQLYNVMDDPEERNNLAEKMPLTVEAMKARIVHHLDNAVELDLSHMHPVAAAKDPSYNGIWTPGWC